MIEADGRIYAFTREGITEYSDAEEKSLIAGEDTIQSYTTLTLRDFEQMADGVFAANFDTGEPKLCIYEFPAEGGTVENVELTLYILNDTDEWNQLISVYRESHPEVKITVQRGMDENTSVTETEVLKKLNTALANGEGPDLICFDGIEGENYSSQLMDLSELVSRYREDCFSNITEAYAREDGSVYEVPLRFSLPGMMETGVLSGSESVWDQLAGIGEGEDISMPAASSRNMIEMLCRIYLAQCGEEEITEESLRGFYEMLDRFYTACGTDALKAAEQMYGSSVGMEAGDLSEIFPDFLSGSDLCISWLVNADGWQRVQAMCRDAQWSYAAVSDEEHHYFAADKVIGINKASEHTEEAMEFLEFALSAEGQQAFGQYSLPVQREVLERSLLSAEERIYYITDDNGMDGRWQTESLDQTQADAMVKMIEKADTPVSNSSIQTALVQEPFLEYAQGKTTLEEAVQSAMQKIGLYQMEQQSAR